jgi:drug/metabolite transporter (DMT)-like permease
VKGVNIKDLWYELLGAGGMHPFEISFGRSLVALAAMLPFIWRAGPGVLRSNHLGIHLTRGTAGGIAMICAFYTLTKIPLADFTALSFTTPLFILLLAALILGERVGPRRWGAVAVGFLGVLVMIRPGAGAFDPNALGALVMALGIAIAVVLVKRLPPSESQITMLTYFCLVSLAISAAPAALVWRQPTATEALLLAAIGLLGVGSQSLMIRAFRAGEASFVAPFEYSRLLFAAALGSFLFAEAPDPWSYLGAAIIVAATLYLARQGSRRK